MTNCAALNTDNFEQCPKPPCLPIYNTKSTSNLDHIPIVKHNVAIQCNTTVKCYVPVQTCEIKYEEKCVQFSECNYECKTTDTTVDTHIDPSASVELKENTEKLADCTLFVQEPQESPSSTEADDDDNYIMKLIQLRLMNLNQMTQLPSVKLIRPRNWRMLRSILCLRELYKLFTHCPKCSSPIIQIKKHMLGSMISVSYSFLNGHDSKWNSQPLINAMPAGNNYGICSHTLQWKHFCQR